jgi:(+)-neomenthol dehydrogenase
LIDRQQLEFCIFTSSMVYFLVDVRVALVTGGNRGMGFEICRQLASSGLTVVLTARNEARGAEAVDRLRGLGLPDVVFHQLDITEPASAARLADFVRSKFGKLDVLVRLATFHSPCLAA